MLKPFKRDEQDYFFNGHAPSNAEEFVKNGYSRGIFRATNQQIYNKVNEWLKEEDKLIAPTTPKTAIEDFVTGVTNSDVTKILIDIYPVIMNSSERNTTESAIEEIKNELSKHRNEFINEQVEYYKPKFESGEKIAVKLDPELQELLHLLPSLYNDNVDIEKSLKRGYRDLVNGDPLKTEMKHKIKNKVIDPLREYINRDDVETVKSKDEINADLDAIEAKHYSASKAR